MKLRTILPAALLLIGAMVGGSSSAHAADIFEKVGTFGAQFLKIGPSARATAMGSAYTAVADNAESVYWNPAGIVGIRGSQLAVSQTQWPADIKLTYAAYVFNPRASPAPWPSAPVRCGWIPRSCGPRASRRAPESNSTRG